MTAAASPTSDSVYDGDIEHNSILFNQSLNPTIPTNGGGIIVMGALRTALAVALRALNAAAPPTWIASRDCSDGTGPGLVINANLIMGNAAEAGSGGGMRLQDGQRHGSGLLPTQSEPGRSEAQHVDGIPSRSPTTSSSTTWPAGTAVACRCRMRWR